jgi:hypothetical protein
MGGATIIPRSLKTTRNKTNFPKLDPLTEAGLALCVNLGPKCQNLFPLVPD